MKSSFLRTQWALLASAFIAAFSIHSLSAEPVAVGTDLASFPQELKNKIKYVIILYPENRSFDSLYGSFPGANGLNDATDSSKIQLSRDGQQLDKLPPPKTSHIPGITSEPDPRFAQTVLLNGPFGLTRYVSDDARQGDTVHKFYTEQYQINLGRFAADPKNKGGDAMSKFVAWSDNGGLVMSHVDADDLGEGRLAQQYVLCDNAFHSAFGGSFLNHMWLVAARAPVWPASPSEGNSPTQSNATIFDSNGYPIATANGLSDGEITNDPRLPGFPASNAQQTLHDGDYWCVNTTFPLRGPAGGNSTITPPPPPPGPITPSTTSSFDTPTAERLPLQYYDTIGDRLSDNNISWVWYSEGWDDAKAGKADYLFQFHHQPFTYFAKYALAKSPVPGTGTNVAIPGEDSDGSKAHLKDFDHDFLPALERGDIPQVCFVKPIGEEDEHPGYSTVKEGQDWIYETVSKIQKSSIWPHCVVFVMYDENGGLWDHVTPPRLDEWGPGTRVPLTVISPLTKNGFVDHTQYETVSLLAFIEKLFGLQPLNKRDAEALPPISAFKGQPDLIAIGHPGEIFKFQLPGYNAPKVYNLSGNIDGLALDSKTGLLTGTLDRPGSFLLDVKVEGERGTVAYTFRIDAVTGDPSP